jgi:hypothetical protein
LKSDVSIANQLPEVTQLGGDILISDVDKSNARRFWTRTLIAVFVAFYLANQQIYRVNDVA